MAKNPLQQLTDYGQSVWYDNLSRDLVENGGLQNLIDNCGVVGITSNPTIFDKAISGSDLYDDQIRRLAASGRSTSEIYDAIVIQDIQSAADVLRPVYDQHDDKSADGFVSLEVSPSLAHDTSATVADARRLYAALDRPNVMIKIPGTTEGTPAIEQMLYEGININITLLFSLDAYRNVADAYLRALEVTKRLVNSVKGHPKYGENSALYSAMGYVPASERSSGLTRRREAETARTQTVEAS